MTQQPQTPDIEKVKQTAAKMQEICKRWDALIKVTDDMLAQVEEQIRRQPNEVYRLNKEKRLLNINQPNSDKNAE